MPLSLPPKSLVRCDSKTARMISNQLTSVIAGHAYATTTYRFYEELDSWLGPWGQQGYPIAYGKFYNIAFTGNAKLMSHPVARSWVWRTTILLQEALRDYIAGRIRNCTLSSLKEAELRQAAFASHPLAYDKGGLALLMLVAPELIPVIATIPRREFHPTSANFSSSMKQVLYTSVIIAPEIAATSLAALAGPAHTGILRNAVQRDQQEFNNERALAMQLSSIKTAIGKGDVDYIPVLNQIIDRLTQQEFPDQGFAHAALDVIQAARSRREMLMQQTNRLLKHSPAVRLRVQSAFPDLLHGGGN